LLQQPRQVLVLHLQDLALVGAGATVTQPGRNAITLLAHLGRIGVLHAGLLAQDARLFQIVGLATCVTSAAPGFATASGLLRLHPLVPPPQLGLQQVERFFQAGGFRRRLDPIGKVNLDVVDLILQSRIRPLAFVLNVGGANQPVIDRARDSRPGRALHGDRALAADGRLGGGIGVLFVRRRRIERRAGAAPALLDDVRQLVRDQRAPFGRLRSIAVRAEDDVLLHGVRLGVQASRRLLRQWIGVHAHAAKIVAEAVFHRRAQGLVQQLATADQARHGLVAQRLLQGQQDVRGSFR